MNTKILRKSVIGLLAFLILGIVSCSKDDDEEKLSLDRTLIFTILDDHYGFGSGYDTTSYSSSIISFNINDFISIDSVFFAISDLKTTSVYDGSDIVSGVSVELFDLTNNVAVINSKIISDDIGSSQIKFSSNLLATFPNEPINLGIRIINNNNPELNCELHAASLILKRY